MNLRLRYSNSTNTARVLVRKGLWSWKNINWNYGNRCKIHWLISKIFRPRVQHRQPHRTNRKTTSFYYPKRPRQRHRDNRKWNSRNELHWTYRRNRKKFSNSTELSKHIWTLKDNNTNFTINWSILATAPAYSNKSKRCHLCLTEKLYLVRAKKPSLLNKRTELISKCRHVNKFYLQAANNSSVESLFHT